MNLMKSKSNIIIIIMFVLLIVSAITLRINNNIINLIGLILFPIVIVLGIILLNIDKK